MSDIGLLPTTFPGESFPLSIIECFMAGKPMMVTEVGEVRGMLTESPGQMGGWLIAPDDLAEDPATVGAQLAGVVGDKAEYSARREIAQQLANRFDMDQVGSAYAAVYQRSRSCRLIG
jgi:hypothetical protein